MGLAVQALPVGRPSHPEPFVLGASKFQNSKLELTIVGPLLSEFHCFIITINGLGDRTIREVLDFHASTTVATKFLKIGYNDDLISRKIAIDLVDPKRLGPYSKKGSNDRALPGRKRSCFTVAFGPCCGGGGSPIFGTLSYFSCGGGFDPWFGGPSQELGTVPRLGLLLRPDHLLWVI